MKPQRRTTVLVAATAAIALLTALAPSAHARPTYAMQVDAFCPSQPFTNFPGNDPCLLCHDPAGKKISTPQKSAFLAGDLCFFCPNDSPCSTPVCTDADGDGFAVEGGACGPVDCDDTNPNVNPAAPEICTDGIDNDCDGLIDAQDPSAVGCAPSCTDADGDGFAVEGGNCGPVDCDDTDPAINPGAMEVCGDGIDNDCDGMVDEGCQPTCPDMDGDGFMEAACGGSDCNDADPTIHPGAMEICGNGVDEDCDGRDAVCPPTGDGAQLFGTMCAVCHGASGCGGVQEAVRGASTSDIGEAINEVPAMMDLGALTDADLQAIASFLNDDTVSCGGQGNGDDDDEGDHHEKKDHHKKEKNKKHHRDGDED